MAAVNTVKPLEHLHCTQLQALLLDDGNFDFPNLERKTVNYQIPKNRQSTQQCRMGAAGSTSTGLYLSTVARRLPIPSTDRRQRMTKHAVTLPNFVAPKTMY